MQNFDKFVGIDWSGAKAPINSKSIAVASLSKNKDNLKLHSEIRSRNAVADYIHSLAMGNKRTLIGIDCNFGYADEIVKKHIGPNGTAYDLWAHVDLVNQEHSNFFAGNFWQHKNYKDDFWIEGKMQAGFKMPQRATEIICAKNGYGNPESPFKLIGAKQVGKGGLAGMRMVHYLKNILGNKIAIWPFDNTQICNQARVVITEIYPRQFIMRTGKGVRKIRQLIDLKEILNLFHVKQEKIPNFTDHDSDALVSAAGLRYLCGMENDVSLNVSKPFEMPEKAKLTEGWIFGVGDMT